MVGDLCAKRAEAGFAQRAGSPAVRAIPADATPQKTVPFVAPQSAVKSGSAYGAYCAGHIIGNIENTENGYAGIEISMARRAFI